MAGVEVRSFRGADESMTDLAKARADRVEVGGRSVWRFVFEPGWHYTMHFEPQLCSAPHLGYIVSGTLHVVMEDGSEADAGPGSVVTIDPGHDAWTVGDEACVFIDFAATA